MLAIAHATGETDAVEELKNLDCALAAAADAVTKVGGTDAAILACSEFDGKRAHLRHRGARVEQIANDLEHLAAAAANAPGVPLDPRTSRRRAAG